MPLPCLKRFSTPDLFCARSTLMRELERFKMSQTQLSVPAPVVTLINDQPATTGVAPIKSDKNLRIFLRPPKEISSDRALLPMPHCCKNARLNPSGALRAAFAFFRLCGILGLRGSGGNFFEKRFLFSSILPR